MKSYLKLIVFIAIIPLYNSCLDEPMDLQLAPRAESPEEQIVSPCNYNDTLSLQGIDTRYASIEMNKSFDYERGEISFYYASDILYLEYTSRYGFNEIKKNTVFDLATFGKLKLYLVKYGSFGYTYNGYSGKIYITVLPNGKLKADWCDVKMKLNGGSNIKTTKGGFILQ